MATPQILLGLLTERPKHGYELKREHDARLPGARPLAYGQVYSTLQRLERDGLVAVAETLRESGPERTVYALTSDGEAALRTWLAEVEPPAPYVAGTLFARVVIADDRAPAYLDRQRAAHLTRIRELTSVKSSGNATPAEVLAADYALLHLEADLRWMEIAGHRLPQITTLAEMD